MRGCPALRLPSLALGLFSLLLGSRQLLCVPGKTVTPSPGVFLVLLCSILRLRKSLREIWF